MLGVLYVSVFVGGGLLGGGLIERKLSKKELEMERKPETNREN